MHPLEVRLEKKLIDLLGEDHGKSFMSRYTNARDKSFDEIISQIGTTEPNLTKHDISHINNVLNRVDKLIGNEGDLTAFEIYTLAMIVLFHDVGNIFGRKDHHTKGKVARVYNYIRENAPKFNQERFVILQAVEAHTGRTADGQAKDTLKEVDEYSNLENAEKIRLRELAAILRFADELEEGPSRTSFFKQQLAGESGGYTEDSLPFHNYSNITDVFVDRGNGRIVLKYHINWDTKKDPDGTELKKTLEYCFVRILKLDDERKYTKYYSPILSAFRKTEVTFIFSKDQVPVDVNLNTLELLDNIPIPRVKFEEPEKELSAITSNCTIEYIFGKLKEVAA